MRAGESNESSLQAFPRTIQAFLRSMNALNKTNLVLGTLGLWIFINLLCALMFDHSDATLIRLDPSNHRLGKDSRNVSCGSTTAQSDAPGCIFDEMLNSWVPPPCYDERLALEAVQNSTQLALLQGAGRFAWYADIGFSRQIPSTALTRHLRSDAGNMTAYTLEKWHVAHCLYIWRLGLDALRRVMQGDMNVYVNSRVIDPEHVYHCNEVIADQDHRVDARTKVTFGYGICVRIS